MQIEYTPALPKGYKRFECNRCGYKFIQKIASPVIRCKKCENPCISLDFKNKKLDPYSEIKLYWLKYPQAWADNIKHRKIDNKEGGSRNIRMDDNRRLPEIVDWN